MLWIECYKSSKLSCLSPKRLTFLLVGDRVQVSQLDLVMGFLMIGLFQFCPFYWGVALICRVWPSWYFRIFAKACPLWWHLHFKFHLFSHTMAEIFSQIFMLPVAFIFLPTGCLGVFLCIIHIRIWSIIWEEYVPSAQVVFSLKFCPHVLAALSVLNVHFSLFSPLRLPFFSWALFICTTIWKMLSEEKRKARTNSPFVESLKNHSPPPLISACIDLQWLQTIFTYFGQLS